MTPSRSLLLALAVLLSAGLVRAQSGQVIDLLPDPSLQGWTRIPIPPTDGVQPKMQWRVDPEQHALICTGDGGHEWLRWDKELGDCIYHVHAKDTQMHGTSSKDPSDHCIVW